MEPLFSTTIKVPELRIDRNTIAGNPNELYAQVQAVLNVRVFNHAENCYRLVDGREREFYLIIGDSEVNVPEAKYILRSSGNLAIVSLNRDTQLVWDHHIREAGPISPVPITASWVGTFSYTEEEPEAGRLGLRQPQIGALHAIASHWSTKKTPATVVMPTGTGKTEVMLSTLVSQRCAKVLVLVPSAQLKEQTFEKFSGLGCLSDIGVVPDDIALPRVTKIDRSTSDAAQIDSLINNSNVLIAIPAVLNKFSEEALVRLVAGCTHLFIDEAHHTPAKTWTKVRDLFRNKPILQFTATPFRNDGKRVEGEIIYDYPLGLAQQRQYFRHINLIRVNEIHDELADREIATKAIECLATDLAAGHDHLLMVRVNSIPRAGELLPLYEELGADYHPIVLNHTASKTRRRESLARLKARESRIIICVNMLGEGFDMPNLKIAAIHDIHKSLAITLQFVGRFTRTAAANIGDATVVVNTADPQVDKKLEGLFAENPDWNKVLREGSESSIEREKKIQDVIMNFDGSLFEQISLWNLRPSFSTLIFKTSCEDWDVNAFLAALPQTGESWSAVNQTDKLIVVVTSREEEVKWGKYRGVKNHAFDLCVAYWDQEHQFLYIQCSHYDSFNCEALAQALCGASTRGFNGIRLFHIFSGVDLPMVKNLGASKTGTISYTMYFGPEVMVGLSAIDRAQSVPNNIFGWGYEEGDKVAYGCSAKSGKVWSRGGGSIIDWKEWCEHVQGKIPEGDVDNIEIISGFLRPVPLNGRHDSVALSVEWGETLSQISENNVSIFFGATEVKLFDVDIHVIEHSDEGPIQFLLSSGQHRAVYQMVFESVEGAEEGTYVCRHVEGSVVGIRKRNGVNIPLLDYLRRDPLIIRYVDGSFSYANYHVATPAPATLYDPENLEAVNWNVNIRRESQGKNIDQDTIQYATIQSILDDYDVVINDDDSGEVADIIAFRKTDDEYTMHFFHCKYSVTDNPGADIRNMYEVCGQAQKSIQWKHNGLGKIIDHIKQREKSWQATGHTRFIKGDFSDLTALKKLARYAKMNFKVTIVQPGLSKSQVTPGIIQLIGCTENYLVKTSGADFTVICSV